MDLQKTHRNERLNRRAEGHNQTDMKKIAADPGAGGGIRHLKTLFKKV
ncbi:MAG: hypothetical protein JXQ82_02700 [Methanomicrobiaceae archaeon]|nr:hypothetical protein [Methanomicrobiaceae archaeon]